MKFLFRTMVGALLLLHAAAMPAQTPAREKPEKAPRAAHDNFYWLGELNKASTVMVAEQGIVPKALAASIAQGVARVIEDGKKPGAPRPGDYLQYEPLLIAYAGPDATRMHSGRSRQDILATTRRVMLRERALDLADAMDAARGRLLDLANKNTGTIVPAYTNGVQAQPTTYAHYLTAFAAAYERDAERLRQAYARLNLSPLGAAALGTSSFTVDRPRLAELLGFDGVAQNSYDAAQLSTLDIGAELVAVAANAALTTGVFVQDIHTQYHQTSPWLLLHEGELTGTSSIMPQKRNPYGLNTLRLQASVVVGSATTFVIEAHNVTPGMPDYKREQSQKTLEDATLMFRELSQLLDSLVVNAPRALAEVNADYSTSTELADVLQREADVPFRIGHHFASELVTFCRANGLKPADIKFKDVVRIYGEAGALYNQAGAKFPLTEKRFRESLSPEGMIAASKGLGGPQLPEVQRMLAEASRRLADDGAWTKAARNKLANSQAVLDKAFSGLMASP